MSRLGRLLALWLEILATSKAVVGVDQPIKAPSMHIQTPYYGKIV